MKNSAEHPENNLQPGPFDVRGHAPSRDPLRGDDTRHDDVRGPGDGFSAEDMARLDLMVGEFLETILPPPPKIPGYHTCWLTTTNASDSPARREQMGYTVVRRGEVAGFQWGKTRSGEGVVSDTITVNEMILYKLPDRIYQRAMHILHYDRPQGEEDKLNVEFERLANQVRSSRSRVVDRGDGTVPGERIAPPRHFEG